MTWQDRAACATVDPELFFAPRAARAATRKALEVCAVCPVTVECLAYALELEDGDYFLDSVGRCGIWGGVTPRGRARLRSGTRARTHRRKPTSADITGRSDR